MGSSIPGRNIRGRFSCGPPSFGSPNGGKYKQPLVLGYSRCERAVSREASQFGVRIPPNLLGCAGFLASPSVARNIVRFSTAPRYSLGYLGYAVVPTLR